MKKELLKAILVTLPLFTSYAMAEVETHHTANMENQPVTIMTDKEKQMQMGKMQENMLRMHEQMHKIMNAKTPQERERLMKEHSEMMPDGMHMMQGMMEDNAKGDKIVGGMKGM